MCAAEEAPVYFDSVADHFTFAVLADGRHFLNGTFEAVKCMARSGGLYDDGLVVFVAADFAVWHCFLLGTVLALPFGLAAEVLFGLVVRCVCGEDGGLDVFGDSKVQGMENTLFPLQSLFARQYAREWVDGWNSHDLNRILDHYADEVVLVSPVALKLLNNGDGTVKGKAALRDYFLRGLQAFPDLRFELVDVLAGVETIVVVYENNVRGGRSAEVMQLNDAGKIRRVWANYSQ
jgi:ketosteroid isomerase-like protein